MGEALNKDILNLDLSKCERRVIHPETGLIVLAGSLTKDELDRVDEMSSLDEEIASLIAGNRIQVISIISPEEFTM